MTDRPDTSTPDTTLTGELQADYSQFELHPGDGGQALGGADIGLANGEFGDHAVLITPRHHGPIRVTVQRLDAPPALDPAWDAVAEFPLRSGQASDGSASAEVQVTGWGGDGVIAAPVPPQSDLRVRYVVLDGQLAQDRANSRSEPDDEDRPGPERYLLQMWPAVPGPAATIVATSPWSQYWAFGPLARAALQDLQDMPDPDRLPVLIDRALRAHPDAAAGVRAGDIRFRIGILRYLQELLSATLPAATGRADPYPALRTDHEAQVRLVDERAALPPGAP